MDWMNLSPDAVAVIVADWLSVSMLESPAKVPTACGVAVPIPAGVPHLLTRVTELAVDALSDLTARVYVLSGDAESGVARQFLGEMSVLRPG